MFNVCYCEGILLRVVTEQEHWGPTLHCAGVGSTSLTTSAVVATLLVPRDYYVGCGGRMLNADVLVNLTNVLKPSVINKVQFTTGRLKADMT